MIVTTNVVPSSQILVTMMMEALRSSETSVLTRATRRNSSQDSILQRRNMFPVRYELCFHIPEDGILHSHRIVNLKSTYTYDTFLYPRLNVFVYLPCYAYPRLNTAAIIYIYVGSKIIMQISRQYL
jgi:hypothetical protein